jgi:hypothetical protein
VISNALEGCDDHRSGAAPDILGLFSRPTRVAVLPAMPSAASERDGIVLCGPSADDLDAIAITEGLSAEALRAGVAPAVAGAAPLLDLSGRRDGVGDWRGHGLADVGAGLAALAPMLARWRALPGRWRASFDPRLILLAHLLVRDEGLQPRRDASDPRLWRYPVARRMHGFEEAVSDLQAAGLLRRSLVDRLQCCPGCGSARVTVREECPNCRSPDVRELFVIHHLRCGHQAVESAFTAADGHLSCPKCRARLEHFSVDYDKPGSLCVCEACGHSDGAPAIGFNCLDCGSHHDAAQMVTRDVFAYALTHEARQADPLAVEAALPLVPGAGHAGLIRRVLAHAAAAGLSCHVLLVRATPLDEPGPRLWGQMWRHLVQQWRELLSDEAVLIETPTALVVMLRGETDADVQASIAALRNASAATLRSPVDLRIDLFDAAAVEALAR